MVTRRVATTTAPTRPVAKTAPTAAGMVAPTLVVVAVGAAATVVVAVGAAATVVVEAGAMEAGAEIVRSCQAAWSPTTSPRAAMRGLNEASRSASDGASISMKMHSPGQASAASTT